MWAVVALKSPELAKTRLAGALTLQQRRRLFFLLAERTVRELLATPEIDTVAVATASAEVAGFARALGAEVLRQSEDAGTAAAFSAAMRELNSLRLRQLLLIAGDLPLVSSAAATRLIAAASRGPEPEIIIVPDRHRIGTNGLLCAPPQIIEPCFGEDSFRRHRAAADAAGIRAQVMQIEDLALDLDCADDLDELRRRGGPAATSLLASLRHDAEASACESQHRAAMTG